MNEVVKGKYFPVGPPVLPGETPEQYTNRLTGADQSGNRPYDHKRNRQCSINYHNECSDRHNNYGALDKGFGCGCPCHAWRLLAEQRVKTWNAEFPLGTVVHFVEGCEELPVATTSKAYVDDDGWPVVELETFNFPVEMYWLVMPQ